MLSMKGLLLLTMFLAGGLAAAQGALNTQLSGFIGSPFQASFISFCIGTLVLGLFLLISRQNLPSATLLLRVPPHYLLGGLCGSVFITCMIFLIPRIGVVNVLFLGLAGQMLVSVAIDSFGLFGLKSHPLSLIKIIGVSVIVIGVGLLNYDTHLKKQSTGSLPAPSSTQKSKTEVSYSAEIVNAISIAAVKIDVTSLAIKRERLRVRKQQKLSARQLLTRRSVSHAPGVSI